MSDGSDGSTRAAMLKVFELADTQGTGVISRSSLTGVLRHLGESDFQIDKIFAHAVKEKPEIFETGNVLYEPFLAWLYNDSIDKCPLNTGTPLRSKAESEVLGISVAFLQDGFQPEVEAAFGGNIDPHYYEINERLLFGPNGRGAGLICPRDCQPNCSYVDAVDFRHDQQHTRRATVMLSWSWSYTVQTVVGSLASWCETKTLDPAQVYVWQCALCCNQYRVEAKKAKNEWESFETFKEVFELRVRSIGHILALMTPWKSPKYVTRAWCIFEIHTAVALQGNCQLDIIMPPSERKAFKVAITTEGLGPLWDALACVRVENAEASSQDDKLKIMRAVESGPGYSSLNYGVKRKLQTWAAESAEAEVQNLLSDCSNPAHAQDAGHAGARVVRLLNEIGLQERAAKLGISALYVLKAHELLETVLAADLLYCLAESQLRIQSHSRHAADFAGIEDMFAEAFRIHEVLRTSESTECLTLLHGYGKFRGQLGDMSSAMRCLLQAYEVRKESDRLKSPEAAALVQDIGVCWMLGKQLKRGMECYEEAVRIREASGSLVSPDGGALLHNVAVVKQDLGDITGALKSSQAALDIFRQLGDETQSVANALGVLASLKSKVGDLEGAVQNLEESDQIRVAIECAHSPQRVQTLVDLASLRKKLGDLEGAVQNLEESERICMAMGSAYTAQRIQALAELASLRKKLGDMKGAAQDEKAATQLMMGVYQQWPR